MTSAYIHIPFCEHICFYCDFNKVFLEGQPVDEYIEALIKEMRLTSELSPCATTETLYIGGGTPTSLTANQLDRLLKGVRDTLPFEVGNEFTVEANPGDLTLEKLEVMQNYGVNRLSMGVQSFDNQLLKKIGRKHSAEDVFDTMHLIEKSGLTNVSIDLIYALPGQTMASLEDTLQKAIDLGLSHYSLYSLILENKTMFANWARLGRLKLPGEDIEGDMFELAASKMSAAGLAQYEISNFARAGKESQHNLVYWDNEQYYGFGAGASGYLGKTRYKNHGPIQHYLEPLRHNQLPTITKENLTKANQMEEQMFLGLRKIAGISVKQFEEKFQTSFFSIYGQVFAELEAQQLLYQKDGQVALTQKGLLLGNEVFEKFLLS
ncbi:radical SAM family heme chaperone HemW [Vagococcus entomophilus]|uniref:Heme chaperone HemW n=1 Tax=Vagococcus entomophilus TaxID=1160095 RepID=A0A430AKJ1_9ENTE|nr:radical SAM family heme chaperone HemW [Vagococcus entomophilus]RSU08533.1 coproporphyrinogen III oxidase [Vagococcus entomophilus]